MGHRTVRRFCYDAMSVSSVFLWLVLIAFALPAQRSAAAESVDIELVIATDVSFSMTYGERVLQLIGFADAFRHPAVQQAILAGRHGKIAVTVMEWGGEGQQTVIVPWTLVEGVASANALADAIGNRVPGRLTRGTAIGDALARAESLFAVNPYAGTRRVIDVSGDGISNRGIPLAAVRARLVGNGITINGLPIALGAAQPDERVRPDNVNAPDLVAYFESEVIGGPAAFVQPAVTLDGFREAVRRKLLREIRGLDEIASLDAAVQPCRAATTCPTAALSSAEGAAR